MSTLEISAQLRTELGKKNQEVRWAGMIPAVIYGGKQAYNIKVPKNLFDKVFVAAGESTIVNVLLDGKTIPVLIKEYQLDPVTDDLLHVDLYEVDMTKEITVHIALEFVGEAPAVKLGGTLVHNMSQLEVRCLPKDLVHEIKVDVSGLQTFEDKILVSDLPIPAGMKVNADASALVAKVDQQKEEVAPTISEADAVAAVESAKPVKKAEDEEGEEKK
ncbi:50S ribosomal protein L25 [Candidatus Falkowbacteria bacterium]|nr:50S ribosomal protein L25 [Candidatus Falkowbacteria bacterium]